MRTMKKIVLLAALGAGLSMSLAACNTVQGVGEDVQAGGRALERSSENTQKKM